MAVIFCNDGYAGREHGYDGGSYNNSETAIAAHVAEAHIEKYTGCVLGTGEHNLAHDSYFYALVWNEELGEVVEIETHSTAYANHGYAVVDATPEIIEKAVDWQAGQIAQEMHEKLARAKHEDLTRVEKYMEVKSLTTRGKNKGVVGIVKVIKANSYGPGDVAGIEVEGEDKLRWIDAERVARVDLPEDMKAAIAPTQEETEEIMGSARARARGLFREATRKAEAALLV